MKNQQKIFYDFLKKKLAPPVCPHCDKKLKNFNVIFGNVAYYHGDVFDDIECPHCFKYCKVTVYILLHSGQK